MVTLFDEEFIMRAHDKTIRDQSVTEGINIGKAEGINIGKAEGINIGKIEGIVNTCKRFKASITDAVEQVMAELGYSKEQAAAEVKKLW